MLFANIQPAIQDTAITVADTLNRASELGFNIKNIWDVDCNGNGNSIAIAIMGMSIVFVALIIIYLLFNNLAKVFLSRATNKMKRTNPEFKKEDYHIPGEVNAAIATALHLHFSEIHDFENTVLTIKKVSKTYSPWSSKIYNLRQHPRQW